MDDQTHETQPVRVIIGGPRAGQPWGLPQGHPLPWEVPQGRPSRRPEPEVREVSSDFTTHDFLCPFDGLAAVRVSQHTGREYIGCPVCHVFARPGDRPPLALQTDRTAALRRLVAATAPLLRRSAGLQSA
jgi:hypothetical protein